MVLFYQGLVSSKVLEDKFDSEMLNCVPRTVKMPVDRHLRKLNKWLLQGAFV